jgi:hypothetical protein
MGLKGQVSRHRDEGEDDGVQGYATDENATRTKRGDRDRSDEESERDHAQEDEEDLLRPPPPIEERGEDSEAAEDRDQVKQASEAQLAAEVPEPELIRLYRPRSVCSRRERLSPLACSECRVTTHRILSP